MLGGFPSFLLMDIVLHQLHTQRMCIERLRIDLHFKSIPPSVFTQDSFRAEAAKLLAKYNIASGKPSSKQSESEDEDGEMEEGESGEGEEGESDGEGEEGESGMEDEGSEEEDEAEVEEPHPSKKPKTVAAAKNPSAIAARQPASVIDSLAVAAASKELPFTLPIPASYEKFAALVAGRPPQELALAIQRIRVCNAPALAADSKRKLQVCASTQA